MRRLAVHLLHRLACKIHTYPPSDDLTEVRLRARLAWNNWADTAQSRDLLAAHEFRDPHSARAWDRVIAAIRKEPTND